VTDHIVASLYRDSHTRKVEELFDAIDILRKLEIPFTVGYYNADMTGSRRIELVAHKP
jgi:hypothetical protein